MRAAARCERAMTAMDETERTQTLPMVEINALRMEAMAIYERCLTESGLGLFERFLERHLIEDPPPVALLNEISDDLFQRLQSLRQAQFEVREGLLTTAKQRFHVELSEHLPLRELDHLASIAPECLTASLANALPAAEQRALAAILEDARLAAARLAGHRALTEQLYKNVMDWATALHVIAIRDQWPRHREPIVQNVWSATL
jgi:hypothetical protein